MPKKGKAAAGAPALDVKGHHKAAGDALANGNVNKAVEHLLALLALVHSIKEAAKEGE